MSIYVCGEEQTSNMQPGSKSYVDMPSLVVMRIILPWPRRLAPDGVPGRNLTGSATSEVQPPVARLNWGDVRSYGIHVLSIGVIA